jgi:hypothetical protein
VERNDKDMQGNGKKAGYLYYVGPNALADYPHTYTSLSLCIDVGIIKQHVVTSEWPLSSMVETVLRILMEQ